VSIIYGIGIELETSYSFSDTNRVSRNMTVRQAPNEFRADDSSYWNPRDKWNRRESDSNYVQLHGDSTVNGNANGGGFEFQLTESKALNKNPKQMCNLLYDSVNDGARVVKSTLPNVVPSHFGTQVGYNTSQANAKFGSYHLNVTMPYESTKMSNEEYVENYRKKLFKGIKVVRVLEPLFIAMTGGADLKSVGTPSRAEGSGRQAYLAYGNLGNTALKEEFRDAIFSENSSDTMFKYNNEAPQFKDKISTTLDDDNVSKGEVGDIVVKQYGNVSRRIRTIEFRFLDPFFVPNFYEVCKVMIAAMEHGENVGDITDAKTNQHWNVAAARIIEEGWNARLPKEYQTLIKDKLDLDIKVKDNKRADLVFQEVAIALWNKNKTGLWVKSMFDELSTPKVLNLNRYNWDMQFRHRYVNEDNFTNYINKFIATLKKIDTSRSNGWVKVTFDASGKIVIRDLIQDDDRFGVDMSSEDYEDILFLLERVGAVELKTDDAGVIEALKVTITNPKDVMKKIDNLQSIEGIEETYFGREERASTPRRTETETRTVQPSPSVGRREVIREDGTIDNDLLMIRRVTPEVDSTLYYNVRDLQEVFNAASFLDESSQQFRIKIIPASIKYDNSERLSFWKREGLNITIFINSDDFENDEDRISTLINKMKNNFYSSFSVHRSNVFTNNLSVEQFFSRLNTVSTTHYDKSGMEKISLDKAGLETLKEFAIRIISLSRGKSYFITDKVKYATLKRRFGEKIQLIKYMPYQKGVFVSKQGNTFTLVMNNKQIDVLRRN